MAPLKLAPGTANELDAHIWRIYGHRLGGDELAQLARLFKDASLLAALRSSISGMLPRPSPRYREELEIKLAWIDKRPLAKLKGYTKRVELGDAALFYFDQLRMPKTTSYLQARALILQAKVAKERIQLARPTVPINPSNPQANSSTMRELVLLSRWNPFDLYKASGSRAAIVEGIAVKPGGLPPPHGWYMATPKVEPQHRSVWTSPWMCGPADADMPCTLTFGSLLQAFLTCAVLPAPMSEVGADFDFDPSYVSNPRGNDWSRLCVELLRLCPRNHLPPSLFGANVPAIGSTVLRSLPYLGNGETARFALPYAGDGDADWTTWLKRLIFPPRMPVLFVVRTRREDLGTTDR